MTETDINWVEAGIKILEGFFKDYDYKRFRPFFHGTSNIHALGIEKEGLCPRKDKLPTVWRPRIASPTDRVFFARCGDKLPRIAAGNAKLQMQQFLDKVNSKHIDPIEKEEYKDLLESIIGEPLENLQIEEIKEIYFKLKNFKTHLKNIVRDTDENFLYEITHSFYNDSDISSSKSASFVCTPRIEKEVIDVLDVVWAKEGIEGVQEVAKYGIPDAIKGLYTLGQSIAIMNGCIPPEDLELLSKEEWYEQKKECPDLFVDGGCDEEEFEIKKQIANGIEHQWYYGETDKGNKEKIELYQAQLDALPFSYRTGKRLSNIKAENLRIHFTDKIKWSRKFYPQGKKMVAEGRTALKELVEEKKVPKFLDLLAQITEGKK